MTERTAKLLQHSASVSVIIPVYNGERFIARAIRSVLLQTLMPYEILVVDDGSTDGTHDVVSQFPEPVHYLHQPNSGAAAARNLGIREARGEFIAFLDADDEWLPGRLERTTTPMLNDPALAMVYCLATSDLDPIGQMIYGARSAQRRLPWGIYPPPLICTPTVTIRRRILEMIGDFDVSMSHYEDIDLFLRVAESHPWHCVDEPLVVIHARPDSLRHAVDAGQRARMIRRMVDKALERGHIADRCEAIAFAHHSAGIEFLGACEQIRACNSFLNALVRKPNFRSLKFLALSILPKPVLRRLLAAHKQ